MESKYERSGSPEYVFNCEDCPMYHVDDDGETMEEMCGVEGTIDRRNIAVTGEIVSFCRECPLEKVVLRDGTVIEPVLMDLNDHEWEEE